MKAGEELELRGIEECPECHCITGDDWEYRDFSNKTIAICPQCHEEIMLGWLDEAKDPLPAPYGFTHGKYLESLLPGRIHVATAPSIIVREAWRRWHTKELFDQSCSKDEVKESIWYLLELVLYDQHIVRDFRL